MGRRYWASKPDRGDYVIHSTGPWKDHKYIKIDNGKYIYPGDQTSGTPQKAAPAQQPQKPATPKPATPAPAKPAAAKPATPAKPAAPANNAQKKQDQKTPTSTAAQKTDAQKKQSTEDKNSDEHVKKMASTVIRGKYGNGEERKKRLRSEGESWERIQNKVNEMLGSKVRHKVDGEDSDSDSDSSSSSKSSSKKKKSSSKSSKSSKSSSGSKRKRSSSSSSRKKSSGTRKRKSSGRKKKTKQPVKTVSEMTPEELAAAGVSKNKKNSSVAHGERSRYYIKRDYVAHSSGPWQNHKYLKKIGDGANAVYVYADGKARNAAGKVVGTAKQFGGSAVNGTKNTFHNALKAARNASGIAQRESVKKAEKNFYSTAKKHPSTSSKAHKNALNKWSKAEKAYDKTPLGKAENFGRKAKTSAEGLAEHTRAAGRIAKNRVGSKVIDSEYKIAAGVKKAKKSAKSTVSRGRKKIDKILNRGSKAAKNTVKKAKSSVNARKKRKQYQKNFNAGWEYAESLKRR